MPGSHPGLDASGQGLQRCINLHQAIPAEVRNPMNRWVVIQNPLPCCNVALKQAVHTNPIQSPGRPLHSESLERKPPSATGGANVTACMRRRTTVFVPDINQQKQWTNNPNPTCVQRRRQSTHHVSGMGAPDRLQAGTGMVQVWVLDTRCRCGQAGHDSR